MELAPLLGKAATIEHLLPVFLSLLRDEWPEVSAEGCRSKHIVGVEQLLLLLCCCAAAAAAPRACPVLSSARRGGHSLAAA